MLENIKTNTEKDIKRKKSKPITQAFRQASKAKKLNQQQPPCTKEQKVP